MKRKLDEHDVPVPVEEVTKDGASVPSTSFESLGLDPRLLRAVAQEGFSTPTPIQAQAIPLALQGKDIVARAYTGSGKTAAYLLPLLQSILQRKQSQPRSKAVLALILVPTKELAQQVHKVVTAFVAFSGQAIKSLNLSRKTSDIAQRSFLEDAPEVIVGTPAAIHAGVTASTLKLGQLLHLVIDEADLVLSYGYEDDLEHISRALPGGVQKVLMSATLAPEVDKLKLLFCQDPVSLEVDAPEADGEKMKQYYVLCGEAEKWLLLYVIFKLKLVKGKTIVFVANVDRCYRVKLYLEQFGIRSCILNPELPVNSRIHTVEEFNKNVYDIIIGSDEHEVLGNETGKASKKARTSNPGKKRDREFGISRGIDFQNVACVLNFDMPATAKSYTHRIGRTARAGQSGLALSFVVRSNEQGKHKATSIASTAADEAVLREILAGSSSERGSGGNGVDASNGAKDEAKANGKPNKTTLKTKNKTKNKNIPTPYAFDGASVSAFSYRATDALRAVTRASVRAARTAELRSALVHSTALARHFEENPDDLRHLLQRRDGELRPARVLPHLKHVPDYLLPSTSSGGGGEVGDGGEEEEEGKNKTKSIRGKKGFEDLTYAATPASEGKSRRARNHGGKEGKGKARGRKMKADPLRTFKAGRRGK